MERERLLQRAQSLLSSLRREIEVARNMGKGDLFTIAEDVVCPVLGVAYELTNIENLNIKEHLNYPAIDLGDPESGVAFQVASRITTDKIESTLDKFFDHGLHSDYSRLFFLALHEKQNSYPQDRISDHVEAAFDFDTTRDVFELGDLERKIAGVETPKLSQIVQILSDEITEGYVVSPGISDKPEGEYLLSNLVEIDVPNFLYIADLGIDRKKLIETTWDSEEVRGIPKGASWRQVVKAALVLDHEPPVDDFLVHGGKLLTFHDLRNPDERLSEYVNPDSIDKVRSEKHVKKSGDTRRLFSYLLDRGFSQIVHHLGIKFHYDEKQYIFLPGEDELLPREEEWNSGEATRKVYDPELNEEGELWYAKHFSFATRFERIKEKWYIAITPEWYWSFDGYFQPYSKIGDKRDWIKNREWNSQLRNHIRFIQDYLAREGRQVLANPEREAYAYLSIKESQFVGLAPKLDDDLWYGRVEKMKKGFDDENTLFTQ